VFGNRGLTYSFSILNYWGVAQWYSTCLTFDPQYLKKRKEEEEERAHKALNLEKHTIHVHSFTLLSSAALGFPFLGIWTFIFLFCFGVSGSGVGAFRWVSGLLNCIHIQ
jgi:hypothetical protein